MLHPRAGGNAEPFADTNAQPTPPTSREFMPLAGAVLVNSAHRGRRGLRLVHQGITVLCEAANEAAAT
jgi:hypothetical protein